MYKTGFIGAGNMGSALAAAAARTIGGENILVCDHNADKPEKLSAATGCRIADSAVRVAKECEYIFLAVKPNVIKKVAAEIAPELSGGDHVIVTMAAGVAISSIEESIGFKLPVIRIMPNTPVAIGKGTTLVTFNNSVSEGIFSEFLEIMKDSGSFEKIPEEKFDITTAISGCTPAYVYMFIEALADGAVEVGVPRAQAIKLAAQTVLGSAAMVLESREHPDKLKDNVCSPGGSTIAGVSALEERGFRHAAAQAIVKATEKNLNLGK